MDQLSPHPNKEYYKRKSVDFSDTKIKRKENKYGYLQYMDRTDSLYRCVIFGERLGAVIGDEIIVGRLCLSRRHPEVEKLDQHLFEFVENLRFDGSGKQLTALRGERSKKRSPSRTALAAAPEPPIPLSVAQPSVAATSPSSRIALPPAEYKPLPVGTKVTYDTWGYTVTKSDGFDIKFKTTAGDWKHYYAAFGKQGENVYWVWKTTLDDESRSVLEGLWPLKVGKKAKWNLEESNSLGTRKRYWTVTVEVVGTEILELNGILYPTYVVKEHAFSEGALQISNYTGPMEYTETKWYNPKSGLVLKSVRDWIQGLKKGEQEYSLVRVRFPKGTTTHVLAGTKIRPSATASALASGPTARPLVRPPAPAPPPMAGPMAKKPRRMPTADLAAAPPEHAEPSLPPAEYKPLPVGTKVTYDTWGYTVTKSDGFDIRFKTTAGNWKQYYAVFGKQGDNVYCTRCSTTSSVSNPLDWSATLDHKSKTVLEGLWPLKIGKKAYGTWRNRPIICTGALHLHGPGP